MQVSLSLGRWAKINPLIVRSMRTKGIYFFMVTSRTQNLRRKEASGPYWTTKISFRKSVYLPTQKLGTITPHLLCKHVNNVILPILELIKKNTSICECTTLSWLKKLGYECKDVRKGIYVDGHKWQDVVEY